jgi:glycosyltransferase involved in cell wall biosynthesis
VAGARVVIDTDCPPRLGQDSELAQIACPSHRTPASSLRDPGTPLVSIITPAYNERRYLSECIESVLSQSYSNWEYLIINNGSSDNTSEIAHAYAQNDLRIRVYDNAKTLPVIENHNYALRLMSADSKYCKIVFGDDSIHPLCVEKMVAVAESDARVAMVGAYRIRGNRVFPGGVPFPRTIVDGREICRADFLNEVVYPFGTSNSLLYRADLLRSRNSVFNEQSMHADTELCYDLLKDRAYGFVHEILSFERVQGGTTLSTADSFAAYVPHQLSWIKTYGPLYLEQNEIAHAQKAKLRDYYKILGSAMYRKNREGFWAYQHEQLAKVGLRLNKSRLILNAIAFAVETAANRLRRCL